MEQPEHTLRPGGAAQASPRRFISIGVVALLHIVAIWAFASGLASHLIQKLPDELKAEVVQEKPPQEQKAPPPPPPEMKKPPPPYVPPPDINITAPSSANAITQVTAEKKPQITAPASVGRPHSCPSERWYPPLDKRLNHEGTTVLSFHIAPDGSTKDFKVEKSSGYDGLDQAAIRCAEGWSYKPALQNGQPVEVPWKTSIKWQLRF